jgi:flagellar hook-length control protein FliK
MKIGGVDTLEMINALKVKVDSNKKQSLASKKDDSNFNKVLSSKVDKSESKIPQAEDNTIKEVTEKTTVDSEGKDVEEVENKSNETETNSDDTLDVSMLMQLLLLIKDQGVDEISGDKLKEIISQKLKGVTIDNKTLNALTSLLNSLSQNITKAGINLAGKSLSNDLLKLMSESDELKAVPKELVTQVNSLLNKIIKEPTSAEDKFKEIFKSALEKLEGPLVLEDSNKLNQIKNETSSSDTSDEQQTFKETDSKEDKLLKSIINSDSKVDNKADSKIMTIASQLNRLAEANTQVGEVSEALVVNKNTMINDVVKVVKYMDLNNLKELTVKINPKDLGEISIKLTMEGNLLKANISASSKDTYNLLNANLSDLKNGLNNQQIKIHDVAINIYNDDTTFFSNNFNNSEQQSGRQSQGNGNSKVVNSIDETQNVDLDSIKLEEKNNLSVLA